MSPILTLSQYGLLKISGNEAKKLLQGQLTCHMDEITETEYRLAAHCNPQGRVISLFYVFMQQGAYYLLVPVSMLNIALNALKKYAVFYKVELTNVSESFAAIGYLHNQLPSLKLCELKSIHADSSQKNGEKILATNDWQRLHIQQQIPQIYIQTTEKFLPHEINLHQLNAIHFDKGCYTGQEIIARMHYKAKLKNHLYLMQIATPNPLTPGDLIYQQQNQQTKTCGIVVDFYQKEYNSYDVLIVTDEISISNGYLFLDSDHPIFLQKL